MDELLVSQIFVDIETYSRSHIILFLGGNNFPSSVHDVQIQRQNVRQLISWYKDILQFAEESSK